MNYNFDKKIFEILNKKFKSRIHSGYDPEDVDIFFDEVIEYIKNVDEYRKTLDDSINNHKHKIDQLNLQINEKDKMINTLQTKIDEMNKEGYSNKYMMNRLDKLETQIQKNNQNKNNEK